ncbi:MAG: glycosyltransferase family 2 protein [Gammaproteobacteria bacterium]|nr:glycosyltransferase family 2 protein [Gammaproteobacteria bacterium]
MKISFVMAAMNESQAIGKMINEIRKFTPEGTEIILVDSSTDDTPKIAADLGAIVIKQDPHGHGIALKTGLQHATGDVVITADCDLTYPLDVIPMLVDLLENKGYDLISCCRLNQGMQNMPFVNRVANFSFALIVRIIYGINTHDVTTGMFAMKRELAHFAWYGNHTIPAEIIIRSNMQNKKYLEVPIKYQDRVGVTTLHRWRSGKAYLQCFLRWKFGLFKNNEL